MYLVLKYILLWFNIYQNVREKAQIRPNQRVVLRLCISKPIGYNYLVMWEIAGKGRDRTITVDKAEYKSRIGDNSGVAPVALLFKSLYHYNFPAQDDSVSEKTWHWWKQKHCLEGPNAEFKKKREDPDVKTLQEMRICMLNQVLYRPGSEFKRRIFNSRWSGLSFCWKCLWTTRTQLKWRVKRCPEGEWKDIMIFVDSWASVKSFKRDPTAFWKEA